MNVMFVLCILLSETVVAKSPSKAVLLSCFLPGGGQFYNEKFVKGAVFGAAEAFTGYVALSNYLDYKKTGSEAKFKESFSYGFYFLGIWLYSMADAYVDAQLFNFDKKIQISMNSKGIGLSLSFP